MTGDALKLVPTSPEPVGPIMAQYLRAAAETPNAKAGRRYQKWKMAGRPPLAIEKDVTCTAGVEVEMEGDEFNAYEPCGKPSCYLVERSDGDESWGALGGAEEACGEHVGETIHGMMGGDDTLHAVVTPRWDCDGEDSDVVPR